MTTERVEEQPDMFGIDASQDLLSGPVDDVLDDRVHWPKELTCLAECAEAALIRVGFEKMQAARLTNVVLTAIAFNAGGRQFYIPTGVSLKAALRDREIWHQFNGRNVEELSQHYKLTQVHIYSILKRQRALNANKYQGSLFDKAD